ncbi:MAG: glycosyltransferase, partial [Actinomycetes bacterium]
MDVPTSEVELSVVVPVLNGVGTLAELHGRLSATLEQCCQSHEIVIVDDGSRDGTWQLVGELTHRDPSMRGLRLARNSGHAAAVAAGFSVSRGAIVAMIDVDL